MLHADLIAPIPDLLRRHAAARGGKCAYRDARTSVTYAALDERTAKLAGHTSFVCNCGAIEFTSSRKIVPRFASSNSPRLSVTAPVNAPFLWPNNSDSSRFSGNALQLMATKG